MQYIAVIDDGISEVIIPVTTQDEVELIRAKYKEQVEFYQHVTFVSFHDETSRNALVEEEKGEEIPEAYVKPQAEDELIGEPLIWEDFEEVRSRRKNDCGVITVANAFGISYDEARNIAFQHGWSSTKGITAGMVQLIAKKLEYDVFLTRRYDGVPLKEVNLPKGTFIISVERHIMPVINGRIINSAGTGNYPIKECWEIRKID